MKRYISFIIIACMAILFAVSCRHKDLCYLHPHKTSLRIRFDWSNCKDSSFVKPSLMHVYFYSADGTGTYFHREIPSDSALIEIPDGEYNIISYNSANPVVVQSSGAGKFDTHHTYTREGGHLEGAGGLSNIGGKSYPTTDKRATGAEDEEVVACADDFWGCIAVNVRIYDGTVAYTCYPKSKNGEPLDTLDIYNEERVITLYPNDLVCHYSYEVKRVINGTNIVDACATISGMSGNYWFAGDSLSSKPITLPLATRIERIPDVDTEVRFYGEFLTFGHHEMNEIDHKMMFYFWRRYGSDNSANGYREKDVTGQVDSALNRRRVRIVIDTIQLEAGPPDPGYSGGFDVKVDPWVEENYELPL